MLSTFTTANIGGADITAHGDAREVALSIGYGLVIRVTHQDMQRVADTINSYLAKWEEAQNGNVIRD